VEWRATENQNLSPEDKKELAKCVCFLLTAMTITLVVWIVKGTFADNEWVAIGAAAAFLQAIGVVGGVIYAALQLKTIREEARSNRSNVLLDQLVAIFPDVTRLFRAAKFSFFSNIAVNKLAKQAETEGESRSDVKDGRLGTLFEKNNRSTTRLNDELRDLVDRIELLVLSLATERSREATLLKFSVPLSLPTMFNLFDQTQEEYPTESFKTI
jgi:hypothetical protein